MKKPNNETLSDFVFDKLVRQGLSTVNLQQTVALWDDRFWLSQWGNDFKLIVQTRHQWRRVVIKSAISRNDAFELITCLTLKQTKSTTFDNASSWRKQYGIF